MQSHLEVALAAILDAGWQVSWQAVRRRLNQNADELATCGVYWADRLRDRGELDILTSVDWLVERRETVLNFLPNRPLIPFLLICLSVCPFHFARACLHLPFSPHLSTSVVNLSCSTVCVFMAAQWLGCAPPPPLPLKLKGSCSQRVPPPPKMFFLCNPRSATLAGAFGEGEGHGGLHRLGLIAYTKCGDSALSLLRLALLSAELQHKVVFLSPMISHVTIRNQ